MHNLPFLLYALTYIFLAMFSTKLSPSQKLFNVIKDPSDV